MKNIKLVLLVAVFATALVSALAFTSKPQPKVVVDSFWFDYQGGPVSDQTNYVEASGTPDCPGADHLCSIMAEGEIVNGVLRPILTQTLINRINNAVTNNVEEDDIKLYE